MRRNELAELLAEHTLNNVSFPPSAYPSLLQICCCELAAARPAGLCSDMRLPLKALVTAWQQAALNRACTPRGIYCPEALYIQSGAYGAGCALACAVKGWAQPCSPAPLLRIFRNGCHAVIQLEAAGTLPLQAAAEICRQSLFRWAQARGGTVLYRQQNKQGLLCMRLPLRKDKPSAACFSEAWAFDRFSPLYIFLSDRCILPD